MGWNAKIDNNARDSKPKASATVLQRNTRISNFIHLLRKYFLNFLSNINVSRDMSLSIDLR